MPRSNIKRRTTALDLTAMADMTFVLLCFVMLAGKVKPCDPTSVTPAVTHVGGGSCLTNNDHELLVTLNKHGRIFVAYSNKEGYSQTNLTGLAAVVKAAREFKYNRVVFRADAAAPCHSVNAVFKVFKEAKQYKLNLAVNLATN